MRIGTPGYANAACVKGVKQSAGIYREFAKLLWDVHSAFE